MGTQLFDTDKSKAKVIFLNGKNDTIVRHAFKNYKMNVVVEKFKSWVLAKKYPFITAIIQDGNNKTLLKYVNNGKKIELKEDNWTGIK